MHYYGYPYSIYNGHFGRVYPPAVPDMLMASARKVRPALTEAGILADKIAGSRDFSKRIMEAAQASKTEIVKSLIASAGIRKDVRIIYDPDGITIVLADPGCCGVSITLRWK
ncbi:hypothetical protein [Bacillus sp. FJAT-27245]|uniref:hypothetical protein n=1 Tax=Bacillus sp. FJAT-27245 TaxID=1684144 RepID=UPI0006A77BEB|nr:hypothetical protein [Bacillus sp. FJAT-27245]